VKGHAAVFFSNGNKMIFPDEAWPRAIKVIREEQGLPPQRIPPADAPPMKRAAKDINNLVEQIRSGQPPELPEGKREQHYQDPALPGFFIRVLDTGVASWVVQWKRLGLQKKKALGNVLVLDRLAAIKAAKELLAKVTLDTLDPHEAQRERMRANKVTFKTVVPLFLERKIRQSELRPSTADNWKRYLTGYYLQSLHSLPIDEITSEQIQARIDDIAIQSGNQAALECFRVLRVFFKWAIKTRKLPQNHYNPIPGVEPPKKNARRKRVLTDDEIRLLWKTCEAWEAEVIRYWQIKASTGKPPRGGAAPITDFPRAIMLLFLTGCRRQEIGDLQHSEIDLDNAELFIPGSRRKSRKNQEEQMDLCVPLAGGAVEILRRVERRPDRDDVFGHGKRAGLGLASVHDKINERIDRAGGIPPKDWHIHDIRRTVRTRLAALGVSRDVAEALIGHVGFRGEMERTYNVHEYWAEKRKALAMWETELRDIIAGTAKKIERPNFGQRREGNPA
jgi:integrase